MVPIKNLELLFVRPLYCRFLVLQSMDFFFEIPGSYFVFWSPCDFVKEAFKPRHQGRSCHFDRVLDILRKVRISSLAISQNVRYYHAWRIRKIPHSHRQAWPYRTEVKGKRGQNDKPSKSIDTQKEVRYLKAERNLENLATGDGVERRQTTFG